MQILSDELDHAAENDPGFNGFLLSELLHLRAVEALPVIRRAFEQDAIDEMITGAWGEVLAELGETPDPDDPLIARSRQRREAAHAAMRASFPLPFRREEPSEPADLWLPSPSPKKSARSQQKSKRKMAEASRKANRKKKRK